MGRLFRVKEYPGLIRLFMRVGIFGSYRLNMADPDGTKTADLRREIEFTLD